MTGRNPFCRMFVPALVGASILQAADQKPPARPHILLVLADDLGFKDVGFHGSEIQTPNLDGLAAAGARLSQFYVQPVCSPTRSSLMTGRYPIRQGLQVGVIRPWADYGLPLEERTLAQALKEVGYRTAITGKWHLGCHDGAYLPRQRGFDHQYGHYLGMIDYFTHDRMGGLDWHRNGKALREEGYTTHLLAREAIRIIREHDPTKQPLFLYVPFNAVHTPLQVPEDYLKQYEHLKDAKRRKYAAMTTCMDDAIGRILRALRDRGMRDNTLVLFCSDNGGPVKNGADNGPLRGAKGTLYEGGVRVPALATWPGRIKPGTVVNEPLHIVDWYPTLLKLAGAPLDQPLPLDGLDAWPAIAHGKPSPHTEILHNHEPDRAAIRRGNFKLIIRVQRGGAPRRGQSEPITELFDISADPQEKNNLAEEHPEKVRELRAGLEVYTKQAVPPKNARSGKKPPGFKTPVVWGETERKGG